jgi:hypothetical protein
MVTVTLWLTMAELGTFTVMALTVSAKNKDNARKQNNNVMREFRRVVMMSSSPHGIDPYCHAA